MATNYSGFAEGFQGGFGLMSDAFDKSRLRDIQEQERKDMAEYRIGQQGLDREKLAEQKRSNEASESAASLAATRAEEAKIRADALEKQRLGILDLNAKAAGVKAGTADTVAQAAADAAKAERDSAEKDALAEEHALLTQELYRISKLPPEQRNLPQYTARTDEILGELEGSNFYNPSNSMRADMGSYAQEIGGLMSRISAGEAIEKGDVSANVRAGITEAFNIANARYVGSTITPEDFPMAPSNAEGGTILSVTVHDVEIVSGTPATLAPMATPAAAGQLKAKVAVKYKDKNGTVGYYYPDLTNGRSGTNNTPFNITLDNAAQVVAGKSMMYSDLQADPTFREHVENRIIETKKGGVKAFNDENETMLKTILGELREIASTTGTVGTDTDSLLMQDHGPKYGGIIEVGEDAQDLINNVDDLKAKIRERNLYGRSMRSEIERSDGFLKNARNGLAALQVGLGRVKPTLNFYGGRNIVSKEPTSGLEEFLGRSMDELTDQQVVNLNDMFESDGSISPENRARLDRFKANLI